MLLIAENIIQIIFRELVKARARMIASFKNTPHQKHGMSQFVMNAGESQCAFDSPAINLSFEAATFEFVKISLNERVSQRGLCCSGWR